MDYKQLVRFDIVLPKGCAKPEFSRGTFIDRQMLYKAGADWETQKRPMGDANERESGLGRR